MEHSATCTVCGKSFSRTRPIRGQTCSKACTNAFRISKRPTRTCAHCGKAFSKPASSVVRFCSIACFNRSSSRGTNAVKPMVQECAHCGNEFRRSAGQIKRRFCSRACALSAKYGPRQKVLIGVGRASKARKNGNRAMFIREFREAFPFCQRCGWKDEPAVLHVHHKNRDRNTRDRSQLEVLCPNCHSVEHYRAKDRFGRV